MVEVRQQLRPENVLGASFTSLGERIAPKLRSAMAAIVNAMAMPRDKY